MNLLFCKVLLYYPLDRFILGTVDSKTCSEERISIGWTVITPFWALLSCLKENSLTVPVTVVLGREVQDAEAEQAELVQRSDQLIAELQAADVLVLGVPMYNFGIPSTLKSYFDHIARAGVTFRYTANGPEGLVKGKKAYVLAARGGLYQGTPKDSQTTYLRDFLAFIGIDEVEFVYAEGLNMGAEQHDQAQAAAQQRIAELAH